MADLGSIKNKTTARLEKLKRAQAVPLADPMIGYKGGEAKQPAPPATPTAPVEPASAVEKKLTLPPEPKATADQPAKAEPSTPKAAKEKPADSSAEPSKEDEGAKQPAPRKTQTAAETKTESISMRFVFQFAEATYPRVEALASRLGVKPEAILVKTVKSLAVAATDFAELRQLKRAGPKQRLAISLPETQAAAWIASADPLGIVHQTNMNLRPVALNAFDRTALEVLNLLESKKA